MVRVYAQAPGLVDALLANEDAVRDLLTSVGGFRSWGLARTPEGGMSFTLCETAQGCAETVKLAAGWVRDNVPGNIAPPRVIDGEVLMTFQAQDGTRHPASTRVALVIFPAPPPPSVKANAETIRELCESVPGFRLWSATPTSDGQGGFVTVVADDQAGIDAILQKMVEFNASQPDILAAVAGRQPEVIVGDGVKLITMIQRVGGPGR